MSVSHAPDGWSCGFCDLAAGGETLRTKRAAVVLVAHDMTAFVASHWWPGNPGHVLVIPNQHIENLYEFPSELGGALIDTTRRIAVALKQAYGCDGISTRQHNEPAGNQDVWHFHQHVFPRWHGDGLYQRHLERAEADPDEVARRAALLRKHLDGS
ncbi:MAG TPA: HIT family protein [Acidimicrobiales bacterium]|jgi:histidine triad (HIT) family protein|nr:HIT family protein [Acidimicrobiales bacterium]